MPIGTITAYIGSRGVGFISPDDGSRNIIFHRSEFFAPDGRAPAIDQRVRFDIEHDLNGTRAVGIVQSYTPEPVAVIHAAQPVSYSLLAFHEQDRL